MAQGKRYQTRNRTNPNTETPSQRKKRAEARADGRGSNAAFTGGARTAEKFFDSKGNPINERAGMQQRWESGQNVKTITRSMYGRMSDNGRTAGGLTHSFTNKDSNGNVIAQSGRGGLATRRQRYYDVRVGLGLAGG